MEDTIKITYTGELNEKRDRDLLSVMSSNGYEFIGSGYDINKGIRDLRYLVPNPSEVKT